jgi:ABC-type sugar transport system permease subunit
LTLGHHRGQLPAVLASIKQQDTRGCLETPQLYQIPLILRTLLFLACFLVAPYFNMLVMSVRNPSTSAAYAPGFTVANYTRALTDPYYLGVLAQTIALGAVTTLICALIAYPVAYHLARTRSRWKGLLYVGVLSPLLVGVVIRCYGWIILLANNGLINNAVTLCCTDQQSGEVSPRIHFHVRRTYSGRPSSSMRFSEATAMATSVVCRPSVRERSASPITRL